MKKIIITVWAFLLLCAGISVYAATVSYSTTSPTSWDVTAMLTWVGITFLNGETYLFTGNGSYIFEYSYLDGSGNTVTGNQTATVNNIDKTVTWGISYSPSSSTTGNVTATVSFVESGVTITNNSGSTTYLFTGNTSFTFTFQDAVGNTGSTTATVTWITTNAPTVTKLWNGTADYSIASWASANLVFSNAIANTGAIQTTITSRASGTPSYTRSWATLIITANSGAVSWANDVSASVTDTLGNTASNLLLIDSYIEPVVGGATDTDDTPEPTVTTSTDYCPLGDKSASTTDGKCYVVRTGDITSSKYSAETNEAYLFAYSKWITDAATVKSAAVTSLITRKQFAKMASLFALNVLHKTPEIWLNCTFTDMRWETTEMKTSAILACKLRIMGINKSGQPNTTFNPNGNLTRAHLGTILSRLLRWDANNLNTVDYYRNHFTALKTAGIMTKTDDPTMKEIRGNIMIMLKRAADK